MQNHFDTKHPHIVMYWAVAWQGFRSRCAELCWLAS